MKNTYVAAFAVLFFMTSEVGVAGPMQKVRESMQGIRQNIAKLERVSSRVPKGKRAEVARKLRKLSKRLKKVSEDIRYGTGGGWFQTNGQSCYSVCSSRGLSSATSKEGATCVSGENRAKSAIGSVSFIHGCWPNCSGQAFSNAFGVGRFCYSPGQKRDNDRTDITVGCFCE